MPRARARIESFSVIAILVCGMVERRYRGERYLASGCLYSARVGMVCSPVWELEIFASNFKRTEVRFIELWQLGAGEIW